MSKRKSIMIEEKAHSVLEACAKSCDMSMSAFCETLIKKSAANQAEKILRDISGYNLDKIENLHRKVYSEKFRAAEILESAIKDADYKIDDALLALEDGEYLAKCGYTDDDQTAVEIAHRILESGMKGENHYIDMPAITATMGCKDLLEWAKMCVMDDRCYTASL